MKKHKYFSWIKGAIANRLFFETKKGNGFEFEITKAYEWEDAKRLGLDIDYNDPGCNLLIFSLHLWFVAFRLTITCHFLSRFFRKYISNAYRQLGISISKDVFTFNLFYIDNDYEWEKNWLERRGLSEKHRDKLWFKIAWFLRRGWGLQIWLDVDSYSRWEEKETFGREAVIEFSLTHTGKEYRYKLPLEIEVAEGVVTHKFPYSFKKDIPMVRPSVKIIRTPGLVIPTVMGKGENSWDQEDRTVGDITFAAIEKKKVAHYVNIGNPRGIKIISIDGLGPTDSHVYTYAAEAFITSIQQDWHKYGKGEDEFVDSETIH